MDANRNSSSRNVCIPVQSPPKLYLGLMYARDPLQFSIVSLQYTLQLTEHLIPMLLGSHLYILS